MTRVAVLGGGQLGWMLGLAGIPLGLLVRVPRSRSPARRPRAVGDLVVGALDDVAAAAQRGRRAPTSSPTSGKACPRRPRARSKPTRPCYPPPRALDVAQDRLVEKTTLRGARHRDRAVRARSTRPPTSTPRSTTIGLPGGAEDAARRLRRQGPGRAARRRPTSTRAWTELGARAVHPRGLRRRSTASCRSSRCAAATARSRAGRWSRTTHRDGILRAHARARARARRRAPGARRGVRSGRCSTSSTTSASCCVELFDVGGELLANEIAPRVHNSGHWTIEGAETSQFENHLRAILGLPLGSTAARGPSAMVNCIGAHARPRRDARASRARTCTTTARRRARAARSATSRSTARRRPTHARSARSRRVRDRAMRRRRSRVASRRRRPRCPSRRAPRRCAGPATAPSAAPRPPCARSAARAPAAARRRAR